MMAECDSCVSHQSISNNNDERTTKVEKKRISRKELVRRTKIDTLLEVYNDLGTKKWIETGESWDTGLKTVRIRNSICNSIRMNLKKTDRVDFEHFITIYYKDR